MNKKTAAVLAAVVYWISTISVQGLELNQLNALSAVVMEVSTGRILYEKNAAQERAMASTTKIMTLIVALEANVAEEIAQVSELAASQPIVRMGAIAGEQYRMKDLYYAMMLESWNDTAVIIAEHISGSVEAFCEKMTEKAQELGALHTQFRTPNGLDAEGHYTTAADMARIAAYAMGIPEFLEIAGTRSHVIQTNQGNSRSFALSNHNPMLDRYDGTVGGKTGFTDESGLCLVTMVHREEADLVTVVLGSGWPPHSDYRIADAKALLDYGYDHFSFQKIVEVGLQSEEVVSVRDGVTDYVRTHVTEDYQYYLCEEDVVRLEWNLPYSIQAPIQAGQSVGALTVYVNDAPVVTLEAVADQSCQRRSWSYYWAQLWQTYSYLTGQL